MYLSLRGRRLLKKLNQNLWLSNICIFPFSRMNRQPLEVFNYDAHLWYRYAKHRSSPFDFKGILHRRWPNIEQKSVIFFRNERNFSHNQNIVRRFQSFQRHRPAYCAVYSTTRDSNWNGFQLRIWIFEMRNREKPKLKTTMNQRRIIVCFWSSTFSFWEARIWLKNVVAIELAESIDNSS